MIAIYARVSTEDQLKGYSIEGQIEDCERLIGTKEYLVYKDEGITGEIINRPELMRLQREIESGLITRVVCYDPDRLSRKLSVQLLLTEHFQKYNVELQFVKHEYKADAEGNLFFQVRGAFSEFDKAKIKHNTMTGRYRKAKNGLVVKNGNLYGYSYDKANNTYVINEKEAAIIEMMFESYTTNRFKGINGLANHLTEIGAPTKKGAKVWHRQVVRQILMNEAYTGTYIQNRWDTVGDYVKRQSGEKVERGKMRPEEEWIISNIPAIISKEQFDYAQQLLEQGKRRHTKLGKHNYLLSGLVRCGQCGNTMPGKRRLSHGKDYFIYTCQKNTAGAKSKGCGKQMSENKLNTFVWDNLLEFFNNPDKINEFTDDETPKYIEDETKHLETEIQKTKKGRKRLFQLVTSSEDDDLDLEEIKEEIRNLQLKEKELTIKYNQLTDELKVDKIKEPSQLALGKAIEVYLENRTQEFSFEEKQHLIRMIVKEVTVVDSETVNIQLF
ncbi:recombinase family protein [Neobacillus niacini]|uniref:recombinase family protein n=1 Tax=Neobacillus niacini TaxID=86668 RepID=UPI0030031053